MSQRLFMTTDAVGGVWHYATSLAAELAREGMEVRLGIVGPAPSPRKAAALARHEGVDAVDLGVPLDWLAGGSEAVAECRRAILAAAADWGCDLIQVNQPAFAADTADAAPVLAVAHSCVETWWRGTHGSSVPEEFAWHRAAVQEGLGTAHTVVAPSAAFAAALQEAYRLPTPPKVVPNGVAGRPKPGQKGQHLLAVGRLWDESKNFATLDRAAAGVAWPVRLIGARTSPDGYAGVTFPRLQEIGEVDARTMAWELAAAPIFVSPSVYEPFGLAVLEAAQAGAALLLSDIPVFRELWDGAATFFDPRDPFTLADRANELIHDPASLAARAEAAERRSREFGIDRTVAGMRALYAQAHADRSTAEACA